MHSDQVGARVGGSNDDQTAQETTGVRCIHRRGIGANAGETLMNRFVHHASRRAAANSEFTHARYIAVPALLFVAAIVLALSIGALEGATTAAFVPQVTIEEGPIVPFGA